ncbi:hypothetical protein ES703_69849 [subsurface metagenome]
MKKLTEVEELIWKNIEKNCVGKENAVTQMTLFGLLGFYSEYKTPPTFRALRRMMRGLKQKRPLLESLSNSPGYYKPKDWGEINDCLERRRKTAVRQLSLNKQMLLVCKDLFPNQVAEQLRLFDEELLKDLDTPQKGEKTVSTRQFGKNGVKVTKK